MPRVAHASFRRAVMGLAIAVLGLPLVAGADTLVLKNRVTYKGAILSENDREVTILSDGLQWTFKREQVQSLDRDQASADKELAAKKKRQKARELAEQEAADREFIERHMKGGARPAKSSSSGTTTVARASSSHDVIVYSTSWCGYCKKAKAFLRNKNVAFTEKDIEADSSANEEMRRKCYAKGIRPGGVPIIDIDGTLIAGYDESSMQAALNRR